MIKNEKKNGKKMCRCGMKNNIDIHRYLDIDIDIYVSIYIDIDIFHT